MKRSAIVLSVWIAALCTPTTQAADNVKISRASLLTQPCFSCHGTNGNSTGIPIPSLAGQTEAALSVSLLAFKKGERPATLMTRIAKGYSDEDLQLIANYLATEAKPTH
ncbi:c-type cytochrome [uncultured Thiothrix sp.]|jgi:sulfide dehydrogenase cytochrome subunit|uniref:c-type cytochrome n=1 Tax=uncultured Thiothrix sp. TaxID=223185 RepID=UPI00260183C2|nr:c-type cytochrome [uncultured Thiothrix sp.]HMT94317.1 c-type cytochrome [Thiolinea sp.]